MSLSSNNDSPQFGANNAGINLPEQTEATHQSENEPGTRDSTGQVTTRRRLFGITDSGDRGWEPRRESLLADQKEAMGSSDVGTLFEEYEDEATVIKIDSEPGFSRAANVRRNAVPARPTEPPTKPATDVADASNEAPALPATWELMGRERPVLTNMEIPKPNDQTVATVRCKTVEDALARNAEGKMRVSFGKHALIKLFDELQKLRSVNLGIPRGLNVRQGVILNSRLNEATLDPICKQVAVKLGDHNGKLTMTIRTKELPNQDNVPDMKNSLATKGISLRIEREASGQRGNLVLTFEGSGHVRMAGFSSDSIQLWQK